MKINWGLDLDPPLLVLNKRDLARFGYKNLKIQTERSGMRGFVVVDQWPRPILAMYRRW